jgi:hypothetical protein
VKYMLLMSGRLNDYEEMGTWSEAELKAHIEFMGAFNEGLTKAGELVDAQGLVGPEQAKIVQAQDTGAPIVSDGPFAETKEFLAGYWIVDVETPGRAIEIAAAASAAPGHGGAQVNVPIEIRQIGEAPDL